MRGTLLVFDPDPEVTSALAGPLSREGHAVERESDRGRVLQRMQRPEIEVLVVPVEPAAERETLAGQALALRPDLAIVLVTPREHVPAASRAIGAGAFDLVVSPVDSELLTLAIQRALRHHRLVAELARLRSEAGPTSAVFQIHPGDVVDALVSADEIERRYVLHVLAAVKGNKSRAARVLGFDRRTLYRKLERNAELGLGEPMVRKRGAA